MRAVAIAQSKRAKSGLAGEDMAESLNAACARAGVAWLTKVPTAVKVTRSNGVKVLSGFFEQRAICDYVGVLAGGQFVAVEVKRCAVELSKRTRKPLPCALSIARVEEHQRAYLDTVQRAGGLPLLLVLHGTIAAYAVPWSTMPLGVSVLRGESLEKWRVGREPYLAPFVGRVE